MRKIIRTLFLTFLSISCLAEKVTVIGQAHGIPEKSREEALAAALREAVRKGAGVDVMSESRINNFQTEYDRVITYSFGYVKNFDVLEQEYDNAKNLYIVKISADVEKGRPQMDQVMALRMLVRRMKSPRVEVVVEEKISGLPSNTPIAAENVIEEMAQQTGMEVVKRSAVAERNSREAERAALLGDRFETHLKKTGITSISDFKIIARVNVGVGPLREPFPDVNVRDVALSVDLQAVWTDTGEIVATYSMPTVYFKGENNLQLPYQMPQELIRYHLNNVLTGSTDKFKTENGYRLFQRIISRWIAELDLGARIQVEIKNIDREGIDTLVAALKKNPRVSYIWMREFDRRFYSTLELETRLSTQQLGDVITKIIGKRFLIESMTNHRLRLVSK